MREITRIGRTGPPIQNPEHLVRKQMKDREKEAHTRIKLAYIERDLLLLERKELEEELAGLTNTVNPKFFQLIRGGKAD